jgi:hypothetical protein
MLEQERRSREYLGLPYSKVLELVEQHLSQAGRRYTRFTPDASLLRELWGCDPDLEVCRGCVTFLEFEEPREGKPLDARRMIVAVLTNTVMWWSITLNRRGFFASEGGVNEKNVHYFSVGFDSHVNELGLMLGDYDSLRPGDVLGGGGEMVIEIKGNLVLLQETTEWGSTKQAWWTRDDMKVYNRVVFCKDPFA